MLKSKVLFRKKFNASGHALNSKSLLLVCELIKEVHPVQMFSQTEGKGSDSPVTRLPLTNQSFPGPMSFSCPLDKIPLQPFDMNEKIQAESQN